MNLVIYQFKQCKFSEVIETNVDVSFEGNIKIHLQYLCDHKSISDVIAIFKIKLK